MTHAVTYCLESGARSLLCDVESDGVRLYPCGDSDLRIGTFQRSRQSSHGFVGIDPTRDDRSVVGERLVENALGLVRLFAQDGWWRITDEKGSRQGGQDFVVHKPGHLGALLRRRGSVECAATLSSNLRLGTTEPFELCAQPDEHHHVHQVSKRIEGAVGDPVRDGTEHDEGAQRGRGRHEQRGDHSICRAHNKRQKCDDRRLNSPEPRDRGSAFSPEVGNAPRSLKRPEQCRNHTPSDPQHRRRKHPADAGENHHTPAYDESAEVPPRRDLGGIRVDEDSLIEQQNDATNGDQPSQRPIRLCDRQPFGLQKCGVQGIRQICGIGATIPSSNAR